MRLSKFFIAFLWLQVQASLSYSQCCSAGGGSPIAGGTSQGVLVEKQFEVGLNYQYLQSSVFYKGDQKADDFLDKYSYNYLYGRIAYGLNSKLTLSVESGYFLNKIQDGLDDALYEESSGVSDLIVFPRYSFLNVKNEKGSWECTAGLGLKFSIGAYDDSIQVTEPFATYTVRKAPSVQPSSGANDAIFYVFGYRSFSSSKIKLFANSMYILKGYNPLGEKNGDYFSFSLFVSHPIKGNLGGTLQLKYETIGKMKVNEYFYDQGYYSTYDYKATGNRKISVAPQINFSNGKSTFFFSADLPLYQYVNSTQIGSQHLLTAGFSQRLFL